MHCILSPSLWTRVVLDVVLYRYCLAVDPSWNFSNKRACVHIINFFKQICTLRSPVNVRAQNELLKQTCVHIENCKRECTIWKSQTNLRAHWKLLTCVHSVAAPTCTRSSSLCGLWRRVGRRPRDLCSRPNLLLQMMTSSGNRANVNTQTPRKKYTSLKTNFFEE